MLPHLGQFSWDDMGSPRDVLMKITAKTIVMAMLYMPGPFPVNDMDAWIKDDSRSLVFPPIRIMAC